MPFHLLWPCGDPVSGVPNEGWRGETGLLNVKACLEVQLWQRLRVCVKHAAILPVQTFRTREALHEESSNTRHTTHEAHQQRPRSG